jgi:hypothetical protein
LPKKSKITAKVKPEPEKVKIDNIEYFAEMRKKHGDALGNAVPQDIVEILKAQGRW